MRRGCYRGGKRPKTLNVCFLLPHALAEPPSKTQLHRPTGDTSQPEACTQVAQTLGTRTCTTLSHPTSA